jgi:hypothetical protein
MLKHVTSFYEALMLGLIVQPKHNIKDHIHVPRIMLNVIRTRHGTYQKLQGSQRQIPSASRPPSPAEESNNSTDVYEQQHIMYANYHEVCRCALAEYFNEDPDRNWNYIERLQKIWENSNHPTSVLPYNMRLKLMNDREVNKGMKKLYDHYNKFCSQITDNFETPKQRTPIRSRVSFLNPSNTPENSAELSSRVHIPSRYSTPQHLSSNRRLDLQLTLSSERIQPRIPAAITSATAMDIGEPKPSTKPTARVLSPSPFEASAKMLNSLLEPAGGEFCISAPVVSKVIEEVEQPESPGLAHKERLYERRHSGIKSQEITPISLTVRVSTPMRVPFMPTRLMTPSKVVVTLVPYSVTVQGTNQGPQRDPESPFEISAPGIGRTTHKGTPRPHVAETLVDILA